MGELEVVAATADFRMRVCLIDDCGADLYIERTFCQPVYNSDVLDDLMGDHNQNWVSASWRILCTEGHVVTLPVDHAEDTDAFGICASCSEVGPKLDPHNDYGRMRRVSGIGKRS